MTGLEGGEYAGGRVLLVEDDEAHAALIRRALDAAVSTIHVERVATLAEARARIAQHVHDVALVDMRLPDGSGLDLIDVAAEPERRVPVVIMTAQGGEEIAVDAMRRGALDYVVKGADAFPANIPHVIARALREVANIRERWRAEETARRVTEQYRALYDDAPAMFFTVDRDGIIVSANRFGAARMGYSPEALIGRPITALYPDAEHVSVLDALRALREGRSGVTHWELRKKCRDGSTFWARETARAVEDQDGVLRTLMVCEDVSDSHKLAQQLAYQASHDALTGLVNRREFERRLERVLSELGRAPIEHVLCYLDLDQFKVVNDTCGHAAGDELLRLLARRLRQRVRRRDTLARLGGDEFGLLMEHCSPEQGMRVAEGLRQGVSKTRFVWDGRTFTVGASVGLVPIQDSDATMAQVMSAADAACYAAKDAGRNRVHVCRLGDAELDRRRGEMQWVSRLRDAMAQGRLWLSLQPIRAAAGPAQGGVKRCELLLRMTDEAGETVLPEAFLPAAERFGFSVDLDRWVVDRALAWLRDPGAAFSELELCFINLSRHTVMDPSFQSFATEQLRAHHVDPRKVCFEISETAAISNLGAAMDLMHGLGALGCRFALDDFGTGLSSFPYLKTLPVDFVKIGGSFVGHIADDPVDRAMVRAINEVGRVMGKQTVVECVENERILEVVSELGVDFVQGHAVGRPERLHDRD